MIVKKLKYQSANVVAIYLAGNKIFSSQDAANMESMAWDSTEPDPLIHPTGFPDWEYFKGIKLVTLGDDLTETTTLATWANPAIAGNTDGTDGQVMVRIPKLWYREILDPVTGWLTGIELSDGPAPGLTLHPKFTWGSGRDVIYVGAYEASEVAGKLCSISGQPVRTSINMDALTNLAIARDTADQQTSQWHIHDYWTEHLINLLFYVYYGNLDSQTALPGYTDGTWPDTRLTGRSNILTSINGSVQADFAGVDSDLIGRISAANETIANRFLFVENIFGHIWKFLHGAAFDGRIGEKKTAWLTPDPRLFSMAEANVLANYTDMDIDLLSVNTTSYVKAVGKGLLPVEGGANAATYYCDLMWSYLTDAANRNYLRSVLAGGRLLNGAIAGLACRYSHVALSLANATVGSRLCAEKI